MTPLQAVLLLASAGVVIAHPDPDGYGSSYASSSASANSYGAGTGGSGGFPPGGYGGGGGPNFGGGQGYGGGPGYGGGGFNQGFNPNFQDPFQFHNYLQSYLNYMHEMMKQAAQASANSIPSSDIGDRFGGAPAPGGYAAQPEYGGASSGSPGAGAVAVGSIGPQGGYGSTKVFPDDGLGDRFGGGVREDSGAFPAPSGGSQSISSFSSSSSSDVNGQRTSQKHATVTFNDNGKVTSYSSHSP